MPPSLREMMSTLISTSSVSSVSPAFDQPNLGVITHLATWLEDAGFSVQIQDLVPGKANLIARLGSGEHGLLLSGHTDTVPYDEGRWSSDPLKLTERDGKLYGLGTADMKCFLALAVDAVRAFDPRKLRQPLLILATADEESSMMGARALRDRLPVRQALIGEPTGLRPINRHKGIFMESIRLIGQSGHSSNPAYGRSALEGMHEVIGALLEWRDMLGNAHRDAAFEVPTPTLNLGHISGGDNPNRICGDCRLHIDLRALPGMSLDELREEMKQIVRKVAARRGLATEFASLSAGVPAFLTPSDAPIAQAAQDLSGHSCAAVGFATEGPFLSALGVDTIVMGPGEISAAHQPDEHLALDAIPATRIMLQSLISRFCLKG